MPLREAPSLLHASFVSDPKGYHRVTVRSSFGLKDSDIPCRLALFAVDVANDTCRRRAAPVAAPCGLEGTIQA